MARSALARPLASRVASSTASAAAVPAAAAPSRMPLPSLSAAAAASIAAATASLTAGLCAAFRAALPALRSGLGSLPPPSLPPFLPFLSFPISDLLLDDDSRPHADHPAKQVIAAHRIAAGSRNEGDRLVRQRRQVERAAPDQRPVAPAQVDRAEEGRSGEGMRLLRIIDEVKPHRLARLEPDHLRPDLEAGDEHVIFGCQRPFLRGGRRSGGEQEQGGQQTAHLFRPSSTFRLLPQRL